MDEYQMIFTRPEYDSLELVFEEGTQRDDNRPRNPLLMKKIKKKDSISKFCDQTKFLLTDTELWDVLDNTFTVPRALRFRQFLIGTIIKGIFILHKEKAKRLYKYCEGRFVRAFIRPFNKKLDKVIVLKRIYPAIPVFNEPSVQFHQQNDEELGGKFYEDSRRFPQPEELYGIVPDLPQVFQADRQTDEAASIDVHGQLQPVDLLGASVPMDINGDFERELDQIAAQIRSDQLRLDQLDLDQLDWGQIDWDPIVGEHPPVPGRITILDKSPPLTLAERQPIQVPGRITILDKSPPLTLAERQPIQVQAEIHATEEPHLLESIHDGRPAMDMSILMPDLQPKTDTKRPEVGTVRSDAVTAHVEELQTRTSPTSVIGRLPEPQPRASPVSVEVQTLARPVDPVEAAQIDRRIAQIRLRDDADLPPQTDLSVGPTGVGLESGIGRDVEQLIFVEIHSHQPDLRHTAEETQPQPVDELVQTEKDSGRREEISIEQLQKDFDRIEVVDVDEIALGRVSDVPTWRPDQLQIPDIVVTELERTRTDAVAEPEAVPELGQAQELMEVVPQSITEGMIRISDLMREDASWEKPRPRKRAKMRKPVHLTPQQMRRMINRPLVKNPEPPTLAAEVFAESRPNVLSSLRLLLQDTPDIHDAWEAPTNYVDELKKYRQTESKFTLRQLTAFSRGVICERIKPGYIGEMTEEEIKDRDLGQRALRTVRNFKQIPSAVILRFYGDAVSPKTRPSLRHLENQPLDIPHMARKSSVAEPHERQKSLAPDNAIPPRISIEPYLGREVLDRNVLDEISIIQPPEQAHIIFPEDQLNLSGAIREPVPSAPTPTAALNRLEVVDETRRSIAPSHLETIQEQATITVPEENFRRFEVIEGVAVAMPTHTMALAGDVSHPEIVQQPTEAHIAAPEYADEEPKGPNPYKIDEPPLKHIVKFEVRNRLELLLRENEGKITFLDLCPDGEEIGITRNQAAETLLLLIVMHTEKQIRLEYQVEEDISTSQILIYSRG